MDSNSVLKALLAEMKNHLKALGFKGRGSCFHRAAQGGNIEILSIQKSVKSSAEESLATINYGVHSAIVGRELSDDAGSLPDIDQAHWRRRLSEGNREKWLAIKAADSIDGYLQDFLGHLDAVLTDLSAHATDASLRDVWMTGQSPGIGEMQRLLFLAVLVNKIGPAEHLEGVISALRKLVSGSVHERLIDRQLAKAGIEVR